MQKKITTPSVSPRAISRTRWDRQGTKPTHVLERVIPGLAGVVYGRVVPPVCLVDVNVTLRIQTIIVHFVENTTETREQPG